SRADRTPDSNGGTGMVRMWTRIRALMLALALTAGVLIAPARADDKLHLKDGRVLEGTVTREVEGYVWFKYRIGGLEQETMFKPETYSKIERDAKPAEAEATAPKNNEAAEASASKFGVPRVA